MLALKNKIIYENILTNVSFKYGIGAIFLDNKRYIWNWWVQRVEKNEQVFFSMIVLHMVLDCLNFTRTFLLWIHFWSIFLLVLITWPAIIFVCLLHHIIYWKFYIKDKKGDEISVRISEHNSKRHLEVSVSWWALYDKLYH